MFSRRRFLQTLLGGVAGAAILPYVPKSYFFLGKAGGVPRGISLAAANEIAMAHFAPGIPDHFFKSAPLLAYLKDHNTSVWKPRALGPSLGTIELATFEDVSTYAPPRF